MRGTYKGSVSGFFRFGISQLPQLDPTSYLYDCRTQLVRKPVRVPKVNKELWPSHCLGDSLLYSVFYMNICTYMYEM